jgi:hypothetical protein
MKKLLLLLAMSAPLFLKAQTLQNTGFENWSIYNFEDLGEWITSNEETVPWLGVPTATKVNPGVINFALKLETVAVGLDTMAGYITNSEDPLSGEGGFPFTQKPTGLGGDFRYNIMPNDTARIFIIFKNSGVVYSVDTVSLWGTQASFSMNSYPLPNITNSAITPDSVIIAIASSDFINGTFVAGSVLEMDNLVFFGAGITQTIHGDFDNWVADSIVELDDWSISSAVTRSTDAFSGTYAAKLMTTNGDFGPEPASLFQSFMPSTTTVDTLVGWYKYIPKGNDSASVEIHLMSSVPGPGVSVMKSLGAAASYAQFKVPITGTTSNTTAAFLTIQSSSWSGMPTDSSTLYIDSISIKPFVVSVKDVVAKHSVRAYPNPAKNELKFIIDKKEASEVGVVVYNTFGSEVYVNTIAVNGGEATMPVKQLASGMYIYELKIGDAEYKGRFIKE